MNYPNGLKSSDVAKQISYSRRGMNLEDDINTSNEYYLAHDLAVIHKKPTPIQIVNVDYASRQTAKITEAYFKTPSTTDYNGVFDGHPVDFEAKEIKSKTAFTMKLIHKHQFKHLKNVIKQKAIAFLVIRFTSYNETYLVSASKMIFENEQKKKSLPYSWFKENGYLISSSLNCPVDYLKVIKLLLQKGETL